MKKIQENKITKNPNKRPTKINMSRTIARMKDVEYWLNK